MQEKKEKLLEDKEVSKDIEQNIAWWKQLFSDSTVLILVTASR